jgi:hypothetical protein
MPTGRHIASAEFRKTGDHETGSALGTLTLYIDTDAVGKADIMTQPGPYSLAGDGLCVGRDSGSPISADDYLPPFAFTGGTIERVVVDVKGDPFTDHEKEVQAWLSRD